MTHLLMLWVHQCRRWPCGLVVELLLLLVLHKLFSGAALSVFQSLDPVHKFSKQDVMRFGCEVGLDFESTRHEERLLCNKGRPLTLRGSLS